MKRTLLSITLLAFIIVNFSSCHSTKNASEKSVMNYLSHTDSTYIKLDRYLNKQTAKGFKGSVFVVKDEKIIINKSYGQQGTNLPFAYWIASQAKAVLALGILKLEEDQKLSIHDPITKYFANVPDDKQHITIHQLLTHS